MKVSGKRARRAPPAAASAASRSSLSSVPALSKMTDSAWTQATVTGSSTDPSLRVSAQPAEELVLGVVVEAQVLGGAREHLHPVAPMRGLDEPIHLARQRVGPGGRRLVAELTLGRGHVDEQRLRG